MNDMYGPKIDSIVATAIAGGGGLDNDRIRIASRTVLDAAAAGQEWAVAFIEDTVFSALHKRTKEAAKNMHPVEVKVNGSKSRKSLLAGITLESETGEIRHQQQLLIDFPWDKLEEKMNQELVASYSRRVNAEMAAKLLKLRDRCPSASTPAEALQMLGMSVDEWLAA